MATRENIQARLHAISVGGSTVVGDSVVTRCANGTFELNTWGKGPFLSIEDATDAIQTAMGRAVSQGDSFDANARFVPGPARW